jgi:hypothetical protein
MNVICEECGWEGIETREYIHHEGCPSCYPHSYGALIPKTEVECLLMTNFKLDEDQEKRLKEWKDKIKELFGEYGHYDYVFTPYGMGTRVKVVSHLTNKELDLSDVDKW